MRFRQSALACILLSFLGVAAAPASGQELYADCRASEDRRQAVCDLRLPEPLTRPRITGVSATWQGNNQTDVGTYTSFEASRERVAFLFLVDGTKSMSENEGKRPTLPAIKEDLKRIIGSASRNHLIGISRFGDGVTALAEIGASQTTLQDAIAKLALSGDRTALFRDTNTALAALEKVSAARKALVIISDGRSEDKEAEYFKNQVIERARQEGIVIYGVGYPSGRDKQPLEVQSLERLAKETMGVFAKVNDERRIPGSFVDGFYLSMENGGTATFPLRANASGDQPRLTVNADLSGGRTVSVSTRLPERVQKSWFQNLLDWWYRLGTFLQVVYIGGVLLLLGLLGAGIWLLRRSRSQHKSDPDDPPVTEDRRVPGGPTMPTPVPLQPGLNGLSPQPFGTPASPGSNAPTKVVAGQNSGTTYAWLERLDTGERLQINKTTVGVGRHDDNEVKIRDDSVHRRHANIHMTPQRDFVITDLSPPPPNGNPIKVNSARIDKQRTLRDGDLVELGSIKLKFVVATV